MGLMNVERVAMVSAQEMERVLELAYLAARKRSDARGMDAVIDDARLTASLMFGSGFVHVSWVKP